MRNDAILTTFCHFFRRRHWNNFSAFKTYFLAFVVAYVAFGFGLSLFGDDGSVDELLLGADVGNSSLSMSEDALFDSALKGVDTPWYSLKEGQAQFLPNRPTKEAKKTRDDKQTNGGKFDQEWLEKVFGFFGPFVLLVFLLTLLTWIGWKYYLGISGKRRFMEEELVRRQRRIETLAEEARLRYDDLEQAAEEALAVGDFRSALVFYFSWILVEMDKHNVVLLDKGKTNLAYWRELAEYQSLREQYRTVMLAFERVYFGGSDISRNEFYAIWSLRESFILLLCEEDERRERLMQEKEELRRRAAEQKWQSPKTMTLIGVFFVLTFLMTGCQRYWNDEYASPCSSRRATASRMNSVSAYERYLAKRFPKRLVKLRTDVPYAKYEFDRCDSIIWFCATPVYDEPYWSIVDVESPSSLDDLENNAIIDHANSNIVLDHSKRVPKNERFVRCLESYAAASEDDWEKFCLPATNMVRDVNYKHIQRWLREKPGRTCVLVLGDQSSELCYWQACLKTVEQNYDEPQKSQYRAEIEGHIAAGRPLSYRYSDAPQPFPEDFAAAARYGMLRRSYAARRLLCVYRRLGEWLEPYECERLLNESGGLDLSSLSFSSSFVKEKVDIDSLKRELTMINAQENAEFKEKDGAIGFYQDRTRVRFDAEGMDVGGFDDASSDLTGNSAQRNDCWFIQTFIDRKNDELASTEPFSGDESWTSLLPNVAPMREQVRMVPSVGTEALLIHGTTPLVCRRTLEGGAVILVNSTSFLSNYALTDKTNRILAQRLAQELTPTGRIGFLVGSDFGYGIDVNSAPEYAPYRHIRPDGRFSLAFFSPFTLMAWHAALLTIAVFFCWWPIFGRPRRLLRDKTSDFSVHINATAQLLKQTDSVAWVREQIRLCRKYLRASGVRGRKVLDESSVISSKEHDSKSEESSSSHFRNPFADADRIEQ